jgi:hypothetical protein
LVIGPALLNCTEGYPGHLPRFASTKLPRNSINSVKRQRILQVFPLPPVTSTTESLKMMHGWMNRMMNPDLDDATWADFIIHHPLWFPNKLGFALFQQN